MALESSVQWEMLLPRIDEGKCTPFLGAAMSRSSIGSAEHLAKKLAEEYKYPLKDSSNLLNVTQYMATKWDPVFPKEKVCEIIKAAESPESSEDEPHRILADLPVPLYLTTNYDHFMSAALEKRDKHVTRDVCRWHRDLVRDIDSYLAGNEPDRKRPVVFHLHGDVDHPASLVLTEDDYLDFMVNVNNPSDTAEARAIPPRVERALATTSLLFIGYGLRDWNLRVLLRALVARAESSGRRASVTVQLSPAEEAKKGMEEEAKKFLESYFTNLRLSVYWGKLEDFLKDLGTHWNDYKSQKADVD